MIRLYAPTGSDGNAASQVEPKLKHLQRRLNQTSHPLGKVEILEQLEPGQYLILTATYHRGASERADPSIDLLRSAGLDIGIGSDHEFAHCTVAKRGITQADYSAGVEGFLAETRIYRRPLEEAA